MLLGEWFSDDVASRLIKIGVKLEPRLRRYSWEKIKKVFSIQIRILRAEKSGNPGKRLIIHGVTSTCQILRFIKSYFKI
jgi:hypothetical protein